MTETRTAYCDIEVPVLCSLLPVARIKKCVTKKIVRKATRISRVQPVGKLYLGWRMVAVAFFVDFVAVGFFFYSYSVFFKAIEAEFGGSRLGVSMGITVTQVVGAIMAPFIGRALDRYPLKNIQATGATAMGAGFLLLGQVSTQVQFYLVLGLFIGFGAGAMGQLSTSKLVTNWFVRRRGTALGIAATGISASGVVMPALSAWIIGTYGWREGFSIYGLITLALVVPLVLRVVISRPEDIGLLPDGALAGSPPPVSVAPRATRDFITDPKFYVLVIIIGLLFCVQSATLVHMVPRVSDTGVSLFAASAVASIAAALGVFGKLIYGALVDRWNVRYALWLAIGFQTAGQLIMLFIPGYTAFACGAALFGFGMGGVVPMQSAIVSAAFGREAFGRVLGAMRPPMVALQIAGPPFAGWIYDETGNYDQAFAAFLVLYALAALVVIGLRVETRASH